MKCFYSGHLIFQHMGLNSFTVPPTASGFCARTRLTTFQHFGNSSFFREKFITTHRSSPPPLPRPESHSLSVAK
ncbi:hypothetical protein GWI33_022647 [Rhynchophorus ferrugineus]|uniref:Uncharacterized protein n=1 Tax=Rhynchophorus ferrugineus TaxID=354439 RepID=A0A834IN69_RHYFE|nr:hypothetical protein GWI33_022647 [Rhynchophorus ferrugineus]